MSFTAWMIPNMPYQYKPVLTFLESPSNGILIADEVGLGKTIEAGLIWTELRARYDARRLVIVCPAMLRESGISNFGAIDPVQLNATELANELRKNFTTRVSYASIQGIRPPTDWRDGKHTTGAFLSKPTLEHIDGIPSTC